MTMDELRAILVECAGTEVDAPRSEIADLSFDELGLDSLAVLETTARIKQRFGIRIADEVAVELRTPAALLAAANAQQTG
ncbi:MAG: acyl carrier protein [Stackebrandtia sp.]